MAAEAQQVFDLFDYYWSGYQIFKKTQNPLPPINKNQESVAETCQVLDFSAVPTINVRCYSDQLFINSKQHSFISDSPNSVLNLQTPKLETIFPGKEIHEKDIKFQVKQKNKVTRKARKRNSKSKSLSELEFEELKGFMDLGFLFTEKDKNSSLVSIIPGLHRLGKDEYENEKVDGYAVAAASRPYLSEAWNDLDNKREESVREIRIPALGNESEIKNQLRFWAHSVASVVR